MSLIQWKQLNTDVEGATLTGSLSLSGSFVVEGGTEFGELTTDLHKYTGSVDVQGTVKENGVNILDTALAYSIALG